MEKENQGGYVFISHSHQDITFVRKIRDRMEALGFEPLMFYLKCLTDDDEIEDLIKREIKEREWFVYVDSPSSRTSKWVRTERDYIATLENKKVLTIDISKPLDDQVEAIADRMSVFMSYTRSDRALAAQIERLLVEKEYLVLGEKTFDIASNGEDNLTEMIDTAVHHGIVLALPGRWQN